MCYYAPLYPCSDVQLPPVKLTTCETEAAHIHVSFAAHTISLSTYPVVFQDTQKIAPKHPTQSHERSVYSTSAQHPAVIITPSTIGGSTHSHVEFAAHTISPANYSPNCVSETHKRKPRRNTRNTYTNNRPTPPVSRTIHGSFERRKVPATQVSHSRQSALRDKSNSLRVTSTTTKALWQDDVGFMNVVTRPV